MKVGDSVQVLPYEYKLIAFWNGFYKRSEQYIGQTGIVCEEYSGFKLVETQIPVRFVDGFVGVYHPDNLKVENKETWECNYCDLVWKDKAAWLKHFNETHTRCAYCSAVFFNSEFDDDYCVCAECRLKENEE